MDGRGEEFRGAALAVKPGMGPSDLALLDEVCRLLDRLDRYDALICGDVSAWAQVEWPFEDAPAALVISSVVAEARQTVSELRQSLKALNLPVEAEGAGGARLSLVEEIRSRKGAG